MAAPHVSERPSPQSDGARVGVAVAVIVGATLLAYASSFPGTFVFDDISSVTENPSIRRLWPLSRVFSPPPDAGVGGRPLVNLTFALNHALGGLNPWGYHAFNLALHVAAALTLFGCTRRTLESSVLRSRCSVAAVPVAAATALLWAVHPLTTSAVDYVSQRTEVLMACCYLLTLYAFIRGTADSQGFGSRLAAGANPNRIGLAVRPEAPRFWGIAGVLACALGMLSKEVMISAPLAVLGYDRMFAAGTFRGALRTRPRFYAALASTWALAGWLMLTSHLDQRGVGFNLGVTWLDYALTQGRAVLTYLTLAVWPSPLVFDRGWIFDSHAAIAVPTALLCGALLLVAARAFRRRAPAGLAGCLVFLILAPTAIIPIIQQPIAENRAYLPLAVIAATAAPVSFWVLGRAAVLPLATAIVALGCLTSARNLAFKNEIVLWSDTVAKRPDNARAQSNLSAALLRAGRAAEAVGAAEAALRWLPRYPDAQQNLALALVRAGRVDEALLRYESAVQGNPDSADLRYNFGEALLLSGRSVDAMAQFESALRLNPRHAKAHNNLSVVLLALGRPDAAADHARTAIRLEPEFAEAYYNLGNALAQLNGRAEAIACFETALRLQPALAKAHNNLGVLHLQAGDRSAAIRHFETALRIDPGYQQARANLTLAQAGQPIGDSR